MINSLFENIIVNKLKKNLIKEGKLDIVVNEIYRDVIYHLKQEENFTKNYYVERGDDYAEFDVVCKFIYDEDFNHPFSISAEAEFDIIEIEITYRPQDFPRVMVDFTAELKETLVHEVEHIGQDNFEDMYYPSTEYTNNFEYLTNPHEIPAYVKGLISRARFKRVSLDDAMEEWFRENILKFDNPKKEWPKVKKIWLGYANQMRGKNKVKKFK